MMMMMMIIYHTLSKNRLFVATFSLQTVWV